MTKTTFQIQETEGCIELIATGELTLYNASAFRLHVRKLLMYGKSKSYKLNLRLVESMDASCVQLIHILSWQLAAVNASLVIDTPEDSWSNAFQLNAEFPKKLLQLR
jgi:anti-anti-sigma regulatory factor